MKRSTTTPKEARENGDAKLAAASRLLAEARADYQRAGNDDSLAGSLMANACTRALNEVGQD